MRFAFDRLYAEEGKRVLDPLLLDRRDVVHPMPGALGGKIGQVIVDLP
jgi:hypothetical protein